MCPGKALLHTHQLARPTLRAATRRTAVSGNLPRTQSRYVANESSSIPNIEQSVTPDSSEVLITLSAGTISSSRGPPTKFPSPVRARLSPPATSSYNIGMMKALTRYAVLKQHRDQTITRLQEVITESYGNGYRVYPFGSTCYSAGHEGGDVDICIFDNKRPQGFPPGTSLNNLPRIYDVRLLASCLRRNGYTNVSTISSAAVPIVRFTDPQTGVSCDMNVNRRLGLYNTYLLKQYTMIYPALPALFRKIKSWARHVNLNNSAQGPSQPRSFSSYSLILMAIALLQQRRLLPNLQTGGGKVICDWNFWDLGNDGIHKKYSIRYTNGSQWRRPPEALTTVDLVRMWFRYWALEHNYARNLPVSIRDGGIVELDQATLLPSPLFLPDAIPTKDTHHRLIVLDPFIRKNCTGGIKSETLYKFRKACLEQYRKLGNVSNVDELCQLWKGQAEQNPADPQPIVQ